MIIYKITNKLNGKVYVGQTVQKLVDRWSDHCRPCRGHHVNRSAIASAIRKHGKDNFVIEQIDTAESLLELNIKEATYIKAFNCLSPNGYNLELGGGSKACHPETRKKISKTLKGTPFKKRWTKGNTKPRTKEQREHLSKMIKGRPNVVLYKPVVFSDGREFESVNAAAAALKVSRQTIYYLIINKTAGRQGVSIRFKD